MGNQLVGIAPSQIYPVEHYFSGHFGNEIVFDSNMGSTRFFKVAKAKCEEGLIVVKVFVKHDPTLPLEDHKERVEYIKKTLANSVNCLPFQRVELTDKAAYIIREYVKHSLYDRVSTRPFLTILEKKWVTFQLLCALNQCHKQRICHGDIKLENILITSWNWVLLSDFASFKPTYLPDDNPADYTYFFDTSRRRTCYIAPERFGKTLSLEEADGNVSILPTDSIIKLGPYYSGNTLLPAMDIFSAGCALLELWTEGATPFELSQLLAYRRGERELVEKHLRSIENDYLRKLLASMIDVNPTQRKSAEDYLDQERGRLFPEYFYSFLQSYLQMFSSTPIMSPDEKILRLHYDIDHCIKTLTNCDNSNTDLEQIKKENDKTDGEEKLDNVKSGNAIYPSEQDGLILIITVVTSCIRGLQQSNTMICSLEILQKLSKWATSETILDRILPYILYLAQNSSTKVQVQAIETLTVCLDMVRDIPRSDANVFPEYILPAISKLSNYEQSATIVRVAFARNISKLAKTAIYFLEETQRNCPNDMPTRRYEAELNALHEIIRHTVLSLLTDPEAVVKQTLMESQICDLCAFFGKEKANDIVLSHIMTFLNDDDKNLRGSFFDNIAGVAGYVGWQVSDILVPLLQQGFTDREEFVIAKAIRAVTVLIELGHIKKPTVTEIIKEAACYMCHPNLWIRHEICGMIATTARTLNGIDVQCKIIPVIAKLLKCSVIQIEKVDILLDCLQPPIPRLVYDSILRFADIEKFIQALEDRVKVGQKTPVDMLPQYGEMDQSLRNLFCRLYSKGLTDQVELQLLSMKHYLIKLKHKTQQNDNNGSITSHNGRLLLQRKNVSCHEFPLTDKKRACITENIRINNNNIMLTSPPSDGCTKSGIGLSSSPTPGAIVVGAGASGGTIATTADAVVAGNVGGSGSQPVTTVSAATSLGDYTMPERNHWQELPSECLKDVEKLCDKFKSRYNILSLWQQCHKDKQISPYPSKWRLSGTMVAHLHEHSESVVKLAPLKPCGSLFASGSTDGTVRLWDVNKLSGQQVINKSRQIYKMGEPIYSLTACDNGQSLAVGGKRGTLLILRIDRNSPKMTLQSALTLEKLEQDGPIVDMQSYDQNMSSVIIYATLYGSIVAYDTRAQKSIWRLENDLRHGVITSICVDPTGSWLATGTSGGKHICWDLRFRLPIAEIKHPSDIRIRKVACHPTESSFLISTSQWNNEVSIWNIETGQRQIVLWASSSAPLSYTSLNEPVTTCGVLTGIVDKSPFILTGSSDQRIRFWDLGGSNNSALIVPSAVDDLTEFSFTYDTHLMEGSRVIEEQIIALRKINDSGGGSGGSGGSGGGISGVGIGGSNSGSGDSPRNVTEEKPRSGPDMPSASHHDAITDLIMCKSDKSQIYVISSARDGVIKMWK